MSVAKRVEQLLARMAQAERRAGRKPGEAKLVAVSKLHPTSAIREAYDCGLRHFAENYVQEAVEKVEQLQNLPVNWHFIGRIQTNKIKFLCNRFALIHSVDRLEVAEALSAKSARRQPILLQVNFAGEEQKGGLNPRDLERTLDSFLNLSQIEVRGLMVMPPATDNADTVRPVFRQARETLAAWRERLSVDQRSRHPMNELSMGTSQDFEVAIEEGSTWIRVGTVVFGERPK